MHAILVAICCILLGTVVYHYFQQRAKPPPVPRRIRDLDQALAILSDSDLLSRAKPNRRLVVAFGLDNSFTTIDPGYNREFIAKVNRLLHQTDSYEYENLAGKAKQIMSGRIHRGARIRLVEMVQIFVFRICLLKFFPDSDTPSPPDSITITRNINIFWIGSKNPSTQSTSEQARSRRDFESALRRVFQRNDEKGSPLSGKSNPLNILLPAYEALWQAVLSGFLELAFRSTHSDKVIWRKKFGEFLWGVEGWGNLGLTNRATFDRRPDGISIRDIVAEILRLYPPTKRIKRFQDGQLLDIDVEFIHRDPEIWGDDAEDFKPGRWARDKESLDKAYMPFGKGRFVCPSMTLVGPMLVGILVGALVDRFGMGWQIVEDNNEPVDLRSKPLDSGRDAHAELILRAG